MLPYTQPCDASDYISADSKVLTSTIYVNGNYPSAPRGVTGVKGSQHPLAVIFPATASPVCRLQNCNPRYAQPTTVCKIAIHVMLSQPR